MSDSREQPQITILTVGSRGDVQPFCALALGLKQVGFRVRIATNPNFETFVTELGIEFAPIAGNYKELLSSPEGQKHLSGQSNRLISDALLLEQLQDALQASQGADLLIFAPLAIWGYHIAEKLDLPCFLAAYCPISPTHAFPVLKFARSTTNPLLGLLNYGSYLLLEFLISLQSQKVINQFRATLGLPALPWIGARYRPAPPPHLHPLPVLYCFSPSLVAKPSDWSEQEQITGAWFLDQAQSYEPPADLVEFLQAEPPPICIGFGSMVVEQTRNLRRLVLQALEQSGQRGILVAGWANLEDPEGAAPTQTERLFVIETVPYDWLFPKVAAVVHHCGSGTTSLVCRAGVPSVGVPFFADQPAWAQRLTDLGVSPEPIPFQQLTAERLARAIQQAVSDPEMRRRAANLGQQIRAEDGVATAVRVIQRCPPPCLNSSDSAS
jgi:sterol 3beta-glucosyltransferase